MLLNSLPPEIVLYILSYFPVDCLEQLYSVSRAWYRFLLHHESTIYRRAALLHGFIDHEARSPDESIDLAKKYSKRVLSRVDGWKTLCKVRIQIRNAWNGAAPSTRGAVPTSADFLSLRTTHRIKVDEQRGLIMTTTGFDVPRVHVRDMGTGAILWCLEPSNGRVFAHLEYSEGFLIFDRETGDREVWRLSDKTSVDSVAWSRIPLDYDEISRPAPDMVLDSQLALREARLRVGLEPSSNSTPRGCFKPYALLHAPEETRAYRFVYPTLLTAALDKVYLWDVPSARIVEVIEGIQEATVRLKVPKTSAVSDAHENSDMSEPQATGFHHHDANVMPDGMIEDVDEQNEDEDDDDEWHDEEDEVDNEDEIDIDGDFRPYHVPTDLIRLRSIRYVDHSPTHIFLAGQYLIKVFGRASTTEEVGTSTNPNASHEVVLALTSTKYLYGRWSYRIRPGSGRQTAGSCLVRYDFDVHDGGTAIHTDKLYDQFRAVHVSPCGSHFVALLGGSRILIVPHFRTLVGQSEEVVYNAILDVQLSSPASTESIYLAYEAGDAGEGRVGVVTTGAIFIVTLPELLLPTTTTTSGGADIPPSLRVSRVKNWLNYAVLNQVSCLMLSDTRLFVTYSTVTQGQGQISQSEARFERGLTDLQNHGTDCYRLSEEVLFVKEMQPILRRNSESVVHELNMLPG